MSYLKKLNSLIIRFTIILLGCIVSLLLVIKYQFGYTPFSDAVKIILLCYLIWVSVVQIYNFNVLKKKYRGMSSEEKKEVEGEKIKARLFFILK